MYNRLYRFLQRLNFVRGTVSLDADEFFYPSNILTYMRFLLIPPTLFYLKNPKHQRIAQTCIALAIFTDIADGPIARHRKEVSDLGIFLDPISDKLFVIGTMVTLSQTRRVPWWITNLFIARDVGLVLSGIYAYVKRGKLMGAKLSGKVSSTMLIISLGAVVLDAKKISKPLLYISIVPGVWSVLQYSYELHRVLKYMPPNFRVFEVDQRK